MVAARQRQQREQGAGGGGSVAVAAAAGAAPWQQQRQRQLGCGGGSLAAAVAAWMQWRQLGCGGCSLAAVAAAWWRQQCGGMRECSFIVKNNSFTIYNKSASENLRSVQFIFFSRQKDQCVVSTLTVICNTVQIEIGLLEYGGNKKAVRTDGLLAKHQN